MLNMVIDVDKCQSVIILNIGALTVGGSPSGPWGDEESSMRSGGTNVY